MILAGVQARLGSIRFPNKVIKEFNGNTLIQILLCRLSKVKLIDKIVLLTTDLPVDDELAAHIKSVGFDVFRGNELDVLDRYYQCANIYNANTIVRITGDCPLIDSDITNDIITFYNNSNVDYVSNTIKPTFPDGLDVEVFSRRALNEIGRASCRERV